MTQGWGVVRDQPLGGPIVEPPVVLDWAGPDNSGTASMTLPLPVTDARGAPGLSLVYGGSRRNGLFGVDWNLALSCFRIDPSHGLPRFDGSDMCLGPDSEPLCPAGIRTTGTFRGQPLPTTYTVRRYVPRVDQSLCRFERWSSGDDPGFWLLFEPDGSVHVYGKRPDARLCDPAAPDHVAEWHIQESLTALGARTTYEYAPEDGSGVPEDDRDRHAARYLSRVRYGNPSGSETLLAWRETGPSVEPSFFELLFDYGSRSFDEASVPSYEATKPWPVRDDPISDTTYGFECRTHRLCRQVLMFHHIPELGPDPVLVRRLLLTYDVSKRFSLLVRCGWTAYARGAAPQSIPPVTFSWTDFDPAQGGVSNVVLPPMASADGMAYVDMDGGGIPGLLWRATTGWIYSAARRQAGSDDGVAYDAPKPLAVPSTNRPGTSGIRFHGASPWQFVDREDPRYPTWGLNFGPIVGRYALTSGVRWSPFQPAQASHTEVRGHRGHWVDIDRSGYAALVTLQRHGVHVYPDAASPRPGRARFVAHGEDALPLDGDPTTWLGLSSVLAVGANDLLTVSPGGELTVWADRGAGRFARALSLGQIDVGERLDPDRLFVVDIDGDGLVDMLYAGRSSLLIFLNRSGHGFDAAIARSWPDGQRLDPRWRFHVGDIQGRGNTTLIVDQGASRHTSAHWAIQLGEPHALRIHATDNHRGSRTRIAWRQAAQEWLDAPRSPDTADDAPPPGLTVAKRITRIDDIAGSEAWREMSYRHWHYDAGEARQRGFQRVETTVDATVRDGELPARRQCAWFAVGDAAVDEAAIVNVGTRTTRWLADSDRDEILAPDHPARTTMQRALAGSLLRTDTYVMDGPSFRLDSRRVFRYLIRVTDADAADGSEGSANVGSMAVILLEHVDESFGDSPADPRRMQAIFLNHDAFGFPRRSIAIGCARAEGVAPDDPDDAALWHASRDEQQAHHAVDESLDMRWHLTGNDIWCLNIPGEHRSQHYVLARDELSCQDMHAEWFEAPDHAETGSPRRLLSLSCAHYDDYAHITEPRFPPLLASATRAAMETAALDEFGQVLSLETRDAILQEGGYVPMHSRLLSRGESLLAFVTSRTEYDSVEHFHRVLRTSPGLSAGWTQYDYDAHDLFAVGETDALGWHASVEIDYRRMRPWKSVDANGITRSVVMDAFGAVRADSIQGKERDGADGIVERSFAAISLDDAPRTMDSEACLADPAAALGGMANVWVVDDSAWDQQETVRSPVSIVHLMADRYPADPDQQILRKVTHIDGQGRILQVATATEAIAGASWCMTSTASWHPDGALLRTWRPWAADDWRFSAPSADRSFDRYVWDGRGRLTETITAANTCHRTHYHNWYLTEDDANRIASAGDTPAPVPSTPWMLAVAPGGGLIRRGRYLRDESTGTSTLLMDRAIVDDSGRIASVCDARSMPDATPVRIYPTRLGGGRSWSADAGETWRLHGDCGQMLWQRDARAISYRTTYDSGLRPITCATGDAAQGRVVARLFYTTPATSREGDNLAMAAQRVYQTAGREDTEHVSLQGIAIRQTSRLIAADIVDWRDGGNWDALLEPEVSTVSTEVDALGSVTAITDASGHCRSYRYGLDGRLTTATLRCSAGPEQPIMSSIMRDAWGRMVSARLGADMTKSWAYDEASGELLSTRTEREAGIVVHQRQRVVDRVGNVLACSSTLGQTTFAYDSLYRLSRATGDAHPLAVNDGTLPPLGTSGDLTDGRPYERTYTYDANDNLVVVRHTAQGASSDVLRMTIARVSNRAVVDTLTVDPDLVDMYFDEAGHQQVSGSGGLTLTWNDEGRLYTADAADARNRHEVHLCGGNGRRRRTRWSQGDASGEIRRDGALERRRGSAASRDIVDCSVGSIGIHAIATPTGAAISWELDDEQLAESFVVDTHGTLITAERYYPYGTTAQRWAASKEDDDLKPRRYAGNPRDDTGLYDYGARSLLPWLGRWASSDPAGDTGGMNRYTLVRGNPSTHTDLDGMAGDDEPMDVGPASGVIPLFEPVMSDASRTLRDDAEQKINARPDVRAAYEAFLTASTGFVSAFTSKGGRKALSGHVALSGYYVPGGQEELPSKSPIKNQVAPSSHSGKPYTFTVPAMEQPHPRKAGTTVSYGAGFGRTGYVNLQAPVYFRNTASAFPGLSPLIHGSVENGYTRFDPEHQTNPNVDISLARQFYVSDPEALKRGVDARAAEAPSIKPYGDTPRPATPPRMHEDFAQHMDRHLAVHARQQSGNVTYVRPLMKQDGVPGAHAETLAHSAALAALDEAGGDADHIVLFTSQLSKVSERLSGLDKLTPDERTARIRSAIDENKFVACYNCDGLLSGDMTAGPGAIIHTGRISSAADAPHTAPLRAPQDDFMAVRTPSNSSRSSFSSQGSLSSASSWQGSQASLLDSPGPFSDSSPRKLSHTGSRQGLDVFSSADLPLGRGAGGTPPASGWDLTPPPPSSAQQAPGRPTKPVRPSSPRSAARKLDFGPT